MKRVGMMLVVLIGLVAMTHEALAQQEVTSVNVVGFKKIDLAPPGGFTLIGMQFDAFDPTLFGVLSTQLVAAAKSANADQVFIYEPASGYQGYAFKTDMAFHSVTNFGGPAVNPPLRAGDAIWILSAPSAPTTRNIVCAGEAVPDASVTNNIVPGYQMKSFPFSSDVDIQTLGFPASGATAAAKSGNADQIAIYKDGNYDVYALKTDNLWHSITNFGGTALSVNMPIGQGFWYNAKSGFNWVETNRYTIR